MFGLLLDVVAFVKAAARDTKAYLKAKNINALVGYSSVDGEPAFRGMSFKDSSRDAIEANKPNRRCS